MTNLKKCSLENPNNPPPELLAPCGSPESLHAAIHAGADAVYFGGSLFNARMKAQNFDAEAMQAALQKCHAYGVKAFITLNTLVQEKERIALLHYVEQLYQWGADALILADLGIASLIHQYFPDFPLHASTQASGHNAEAAQFLAKQGFCRMVGARELSLANLCAIVQNSAPFEIEMFVHGAICVSHSGQCLMSSVIGGRSGNRGECAQPCRLPYQNANRYPLSIKDLCLANHMTEIIKSGVSSLKIEGRMKSPAYVYGVTQIYRRLLDDRRNATDEELQTLTNLFSRNGFTDGYFTGKVDKTMLGVRLDTDKEATRQEETAIAEKKFPLALEAELIENQPSKLSLTCGDKKVTVYGEIPQRAKTAPLSEENLVKNLTKFGGTPYSLDAAKCSVHLQKGLMLPLSQINALRRSALAELAPVGYADRNHCLPETLSFLSHPDPVPQSNLRTARFLSPKQISEEATAFFSICYVPLQHYQAGKANGVILPPVIMDDEREQIAILLKDALKTGVQHVLVGNIGHIGLVPDGVSIHGDFRFNVYNAETYQILQQAGISEVILSPELTLPQIRDIQADKSVIVYGRLPLMLLEKCIIRDEFSCEYCQSHAYATITDRKNVIFPVIREYQHRNVILNSVPLYMADRSSMMEKHQVTGTHFIFTIETKQECNTILEYYQNKEIPSFLCKRIAL